jgi:HD-GYP domain-containing protein (c-di-GMP phosphodiesterase class II)
VADSFDAMTTDRPYRKALSLDEAVNRLVEASGVQFDAELVKVFVKYVREKGRDLAVVEPDQDLLHDNV